MGACSWSHMWKAPFLKSLSWPLFDRVPSGAITRHMPTPPPALAASVDLLSAWIARVRSLRSTGTPPKAREIQEKKGTRKSSFLARA